VGGLMPAGFGARHRATTIAGVQDRVAVVEANLDRAISRATPPSRLLAPEDRLHARTTLTAAAAVDVFTDQVRSRALDVAARALKARGAGFYTISSAGHEANAVLGALTRTTDPAFLHYRSGGFMMARSRQDPEVDPIGDTLLSFIAAAEEPISGGRHKVWGSRPLWVPPQTSTIASHLPKAVGAAFAIERADGPASTCRSLPTASWCPPSVTRRRTTPPRWRASTPRATPIDGGARSRSCSSARTTGSASPWRRRAAGSRRLSRA
jgi:hypothetical protein